MKNALIIILYDHPFDHTSDYAHQTGLEFSRNNTVIGILMQDALSVKEAITSHRPFRLWSKFGPNYYLHKPLYLLPFRRFTQIEKLNIFLDVILLRLILILVFLNKHFRRRYLWIFSPVHYPALKMFGKKYTSVYDCVDYHARSNNTKFESKLITDADYFFVNSNILQKIHKDIRVGYVVPQGFRVDLFRGNKKASRLIFPKDKPIIGYLGGINYRLDYRLLTSLIKNCPEYNFVFIGPRQKYNLKKTKDNSQELASEMFDSVNCMYFPDQTKEIISDVIAQFDVAMIPYNTRFNFNKYCYPMKLMEYFYMGKPVVSTPIVELTGFSDLVKIGRTAKIWSKLIQKSLKFWPVRHRKKQREIALKNSWSQKVSAMAAKLNE